MGRKVRNRRGVQVLLSAVAATLAGGALASAQATAPNIIILNIDDMGIADLAPYNTDSIQADTPNASRLAAEGLRFNNYYSASPICSPSRAGLLTGQYPSRWGINSFIDNRANNLLRDTRDFLSLDAPMLARTLQDAGYVTANVGKWHLGGGRNVGYDLAPVVTAYGFDSSLTQFEGLGDRVLYQNLAGTGLEPLSQRSKELGTRNGQDTIYEIQRDMSSQFYVDRAISVIQQAKASNPAKPVFMNLAFDDVHTPYDPKPELMAKYQARYPSLTTEQQQYLAVMENLDAQIGRFVDAIDAAGLGSQTLLLLTADNGPSGPTYNAGSAGGLRGNKGSLYEGGIKSPLIARWTGQIAPGQVNNQTIITATDMFPTLAALAGLPASASATSDGENLSAALMGNGSVQRNGTIFWDYGRNSNHAGPGPNNRNHSPNLALRDGNYKLLIESDGSKVELYDLSVDPNETTNLASQQPNRVHAMGRQALSLRYEMPSMIAPETGHLIIQLRADNLTGANGSAVSSFADAKTGDSFNGTVAQSTAGAQPTLVRNALNGKSAIRFDGNDFLSSSATNSLPTASDGYTIFLVATGDQSGDRAARAMQIGSSTGQSGRVVGADLSYETGMRFNNGAAVYDVGMDPDAFHIFVMKVDHNMNYADATLYVDGTLAANTFTGTSTTSNVTNFTGTTLDLLLGRGRLNSGAATDSYLGDIAELLVYNDQMTELQINLVANYLATDYGLSFAYDTTTVVPEPASMGAIALLATAALRRHRRDLKN